MTWIKQRKHSMPFHHDVVGGLEVLSRVAQAGAVGQSVFVSFVQVEIVDLKGLQHDQLEE